MKTLFLIFLIVSCGTSGERTNSIKYNKLDQYLDIVEKYEKGMGSIAVLSRGKLEYSREFNSLEKTKSPIYRIGSISKIYTSVIILKLVEEGHLSLNTKLAKFYKQIKGSSKITIEQLLRHRSGIPNMTDQADYLTYFDKNIPESAQLNRFSKYSLELKPGEKYKYSNTGYVLLSYIAQKVSKKSFNTLLDEYISRPLSLKNTYMYEKNNPRNGEVLSYVKSLSWKKTTNTHESAPLGAGAIASTPEEVTVFLRGLFTGKLLKEENLKRLKLLTDGYGLGIMTFPYGKKRAYGHTGGIDGFASIAGYIEEDDLAFAQLTNGVPEGFNDISVATLASHYKDEFKLPKYNKAIKLTDKILKQYAGTYSGKDFPLKLTFRFEDGVLFGLASGPGQSEIPFEAKSDDGFSYPRAGIKLKFQDSGTKLEFIQGKSFFLKKEE
jgi:D-alanyl-D-alanine carboxypeptidase